MSDEETKPMRALSLWQPWADYCAIGLKPIENRSWCPAISMVGRWMLIHAAKRPPKADELASAAEICREATGEDGIADASSLALGAIVGAARLTGVIADHGTTLVAELKHRKTAELVRSPWFQGPFGWVLEGAVRFPAPIQCSGAQGLWTVPEDRRLAIREQMKVVGR